MQIDWVTVVAQIVNFIVLLLLLKRFLYGPIVKAMEQRRQLVAQEMREAEAREAEAEEEARKHRDARRELEEQHDELMAQARAEADDRRRQLIDQAREEVEAIERRWHENLRDERDAFVRRLREEMGRKVCAVARQALRDLANRDLQAQVVAVFIERLNTLDEQRRRELREALAGAEHGATLTSAFPLSAGQEKQLATAALSVLGDEHDMRFRHDPELLCGVELSGGGRKVAWSLDSYLNALEEAIVEAIDRETEQERETGEDAAAAEREGADE